MSDMRLFYQSFGVSRGSTKGHYATVLRGLVDGAKSAGTTVDVFGLSPHRAIADQYRYLELLDTVELTENGLKAEKEGYDAFLIGNIFEPGLHELRELLNIPVLGLRESALHVACMMGASFSLINVNPKFVPRIVEGVHLQGLSSRMVSVERMMVERPGVFDIAFQDEAAMSEIVEQFHQSAALALAKGAEVLIPAGGSLMAALAISEIHQVDNAPVLNGITALVKSAELAVGIRHQTGIFTSKRMKYAPPAGRLLSDVRQAYGAEAYPGAK